MTFKEKVYENVRKIPVGRVATYGQIAHMCGSPRACRAVGNALHVNPLPGIVPCHRIVNHSSYLSGGFAFGGIGEQKRLLEAEDVKVSNEFKVKLSEFRF